VRYQYSNGHSSSPIYWARRDQLVDTLVRLGIKSSCLWLNNTTLEVLSGTYTVRIEAPTHDAAWDLKGTLDSLWLDGRAS
jgi:hypothetical protein